MQEGIGKQIGEDNLVANYLTQGQAGAQTGQGTPVNWQYSRVTLMCPYSNHFFADILFHLFTVWWYEWKTQNTTFHKFKRL